MSYADRGQMAPLAVGTVLGRAFGVMTGNPLTVFAVAFIFGALPQVVLSFLTRFGDMSDQATQVGTLTLYIVSALVFVLCSGLSQAALVRVAGAYLEGRVAGIGECARIGLTKALPVIGLSILLILGLMIGFFFFVIPGLMLLTRWAVVLPALVEENIGVTESFGRSGELTKGERWRILWLMIVVLIINWLIAGIAAAPALMVGADMDNPTTTVFGTILSLISSTFSSALWATVLTSLYFSLRETREGPQTDQLAEVFA